MFINTVLGMKIYSITSTVYLLPSISNRTHPWPLRPSYVHHWYQLLSLLTPKTTVNTKFMFCHSLILLYSLPHWLISSNIVSYFACFSRLWNQTWFFFSQDYVPKIDACCLMQLYFIHSYCWRVLYYVNIQHFSSISLLIAFGISPAFCRYKHCCS